MSDMLAAKHSKGCRHKTDVSHLATDLLPLAISKSIANPRLAALRCPNRRYCRRIDWRYGWSRDRAYRRRADRRQIDRALTKRLHMPVDALANTFGIRCPAERRQGHEYPNYEAHFPSQFLSMLPQPQGVRKQILDVKMPHLRIVKRWLVVLSLTLGCCCRITGAWAQILTDVATDQELYAAYCLGVVVAQGDSPLSEFEDVVGHDAVVKEKERLSQERSRFQGYLAARGLLSGSRSVSSVTGARLAQERGQSDAARCFARINICVAKCSATRPYVHQCTIDCRDEEGACRANARCFRDDQLPF
jgi:hypothetical protein